MRNEDQPDFVAIRKTRGKVIRSRKCSRCGRQMPKGTPYEAHVYLMDGEFRSEVECQYIGPDYDCALKFAPQEGPDTTLEGGENVSPCNNQ